MRCEERAGAAKLPSSAKLSRPSSLRLRLGAIAHADLWACMECCTFLARGGVRSCCGEGLLCPVRARDIAHARSVHLRTACVRPCGPPCAPLSWFLCQALAHQDRRSGGERGAKSIGAGPLGEQDSANCGSGRGWPLGGEFQREERSPLLTTQSAENSRRKAKRCERVGALYHLLPQSRVGG